MDNNFQSYLRQVAAQGTAIILAAGAAALLTFIQSIGASTGVCGAVEINPVEAAGAGVFFKSIHSAIVLTSARIG